MANSKLTTLWTLAGRMRDSREVLDSYGGMLVGRYDFPEELLIENSGYTKIECHMTTSDGYVVRYPTFLALTKGEALVNESKAGSGIRSFFSPLEPSDKHGSVRVALYKEWPDGVADPEIDLTSQPLVEMTKVIGQSGFGFSLHTASGSRKDLQFTSKDINTALVGTDIIKDLTARIKALEAK